MGERGERGGRRGGGARARLPRLGGAAGAKARDARIRELAQAAGAPVPAVAEVLAIAEVLTAVDFDERVVARLAAACGYGGDSEWFPGSRTLTATAVRVLVRKGPAPAVEGFPRRCTAGQSRKTREFPESPPVDFSVKVEPAQATSTARTPAATAQSAQLARDGRQRAIGRFTLLLVDGMPEGMTLRRMALAEDEQARAERRRERAPPSDGSGTP